ncbi:MAG: hypothetical protein FWE70_03695, partial [Oscillospiraceae bacterium]|nr:hypothetical protein [Oscillospiraceae bacterium]
MLGILKNRFAILSLLWALLFIMIVSRLIDLQLVNTDRYVKESNTKNLSQRELMAPRGNIYDRNGIPIAVSAEYYDLIFYRTDATNAEINRMCLSILGILDRNGDGFSSAFKNYFSFDPIEYGPSLKSKVSIASTHTDINGISGADDILAIIESNSRFYVNPTGTVVPIRPGDMVAELDMRGNDSYLDRMKAYADWLRASESTLSRIERLFYVEPGTLKYMKSAEEVYA